MTERDELIKSIGQTLTTLQARFADNMAVFSAQFGLSVSDFLILTDIMNHPGTTMHELCKRSGLKKSSASRIIDNMVQMGFVNRTIPDGDRRTIRLTLTDSFGEGTFCSEDHAPYLFKGIGNFSNNKDLKDVLASLKKVSQLVNGE